MTELSHNYEQQLLKNLALLTSSKDINELKEILINVDHEKIHEVAIKHGVASLIYQNLKGTIVATDFPKFIQKLSSYYNNYKILNNFIDSEATTALKILKKQKIDVVVLKGFSLAYQVYSEANLRPKSDVDILIKATDKEAVKQIFQELGYSNPRGWEPRAIIKQFSYKKTLGKGINVFFDIHLKISNNKPLENILNYQELLKASDGVTLPNINLINKPYALSHAVFHLLGHKAANDTVKLIWYYDIYLLVKTISGNERQELTILMYNTGLANLMAQTLKLTAQYFPSDKLTLLLNELKRVPFDNSYNYLLGSTNGVKGLWLTIQATDNLKEKIEVVKETIFPPPAEIYVKYGKHTKWPLSVLYIRRIISGTLKNILLKFK